MRPIQPDNQRKSSDHLPSPQAACLVGQPLGNTTQLPSLNQTHRTADYLILSVFQESPGDLSHGPWPCSTRHFTCTRQKAASARQGYSKEGLSTCSSTCRTAAFGPLRALGCRSQHLNIANSLCFWTLWMRHEHQWSKPPNLLTLEVDRLKPHMGQPLLCVSVQMYREKGVRAELRQWEAWREEGCLLLEITLKHITNLLNHCGLPCISE